MGKDRQDPEGGKDRNTKGKKGERHRESESGGGARTGREENGWRACN